MKTFRENMLIEISNLTFRINKGTILKKEHTIKVGNFELKLKKGCDLAKVYSIYSKKYKFGTIKYPQWKGKMAKTLAQGFIDGTVTFKPLIPPIEAEEIRRC